MKSHRINWLLLTFLTVLSFALMESSASGGIVGVILAITAIKGAMIVDGFMELKGIKHLVRNAMLLYCPVLGGLLLAVLTLR